MEELSAEDKFWSRRSCPLFLEVLGFKRSRHRRTPRHPVERILGKAIFPFGSKAESSRLLKSLELY